MRQVSQWFVSSTVTRGFLQLLSDISKFSNSNSALIVNLIIVDYSVNVDDFLGFLLLDFLVTICGFSDFQSFIFFNSISANFVKHYYFLIHF